MPIAKPFARKKDTRSNCLIFTFSLNEKVFNYDLNFWRLALMKVCKKYKLHLSVLCQAYYDLTYDFTVPPTVFNPPPKVESGVMHMVRKSTDPDISFAILKRGVKAAFGQRRKTLRNALKVLNLPVGFDHPYLTKRAEQLGHAEFVELLNAIEDGRA